MIPPPPRALPQVPPLGPLLLCCLLYFFLSHSASPDLTILTDGPLKTFQSTPQSARVRPQGQNGWHLRSSACWRVRKSAATGLRPPRLASDHASPTLVVWGSWQIAPSAVQSAASQRTTDLIPELECHVTSTGVQDVMLGWERVPGMPP